jgi:hypothetical protein
LKALYKFFSSHTHLNITLKVPSYLGLLGVRGDFMLDTQA